MTVKQEAMSCARRGWSIIPVNGKRPLMQDWPNKGSISESIITEWFKQWPTMNYGIVTGRVSGIVALDVDGEAGCESLQQLEEGYSKLPDTPEVLAGGGGRQLFFRYPIGHEIGNRTGLFPGIDIRGNGGMVVGAGSVHPDTGKAYEWECLYSPEDVPLADVPEWLLAMLTRPPQIEQTAGAEDDYIPEGSRNATITKIAGSLWRQGLDQVELFDALSKINEKRCLPPLNDQELQTIAQSMAKYAPNVVQAVQDFSGNEWPEPLPLEEDSLSPVNILPAEIIPEPFRPWLTDISYECNALSISWQLGRLWQLQR
ncbi:MAG: hypothetical protein H6Q67_487 [Firmicutes bacterium]|nr:hypothetical protein [Bacillota bacterium]